MNLEKLIGNVRSGAEAISAFLEDARQHNRELTKGVEKACDKYFEDISKKDSKIRESIADMERQKLSIAASIQSMQPLLVNATISGNADSVKHLQEKMTELKAQEMTIDAQIEMLSTADINGADDIFADAEMKHERLSEDNKSLTEAYQQIHEFAEEQRKFWSKLSDDTSAPYSHGGYVSNYQKMRDDHSGLTKYIAREKEKIEKTSTPEKKPRNLETARYRSGSY